MNRFSWSATVGLLTVSCLSVATLLFELAATDSGVSPLDHSLPQASSTSMAISWISLATIALICGLRPWSLSLSNYSGRVGLSLGGWIISVMLLLAIGLYAPRELRALGIWHGTVLALLVVMMAEGMIRVALSNRRRPVAHARVVIAPAQQAR